MTHVLILEDDRASMEALGKILTEYSEEICVPLLILRRRSCLTEISGSAFSSWM